MLRKLLSTKVQQNLSVDKMQEKAQRYTRRQNLTQISHPSPPAVERQDVEEGLCRQECVVKVLAQLEHKSFVADCVFNKAAVQGKPIAGTTNLQLVRQVSGSDAKQMVVAEGKGAATNQSRRMDRRGWGNAPVNEPAS